MTRQALVEAIAQAIARAEATPFGRASFDWKHHMSGSDRKHYRALGVAALLEIESLGLMRFSKGRFTFADSITLEDYTRAKFG